MPEAKVSDSLQQTKATGVLCVRVIIAVVLLATGAIKIFSPAESVGMAIAHKVPLATVAVVIQVELVIALCLVVGYRPRWTLAATAGLFAIFGAFSLYRSWTGFESCGCFGSLKISPSITAVLDLVILLLAAWAAWVSPPVHSVGIKRVWIATITCVAVASLSGKLLGDLASVRLTHTDPPRVGGLFVLEPETWIGKPFPLAAHLIPNVPINQGRWTILIHQHSCKRCQVAVPLYENLATSAGDRRIAIVEIPPYGPLYLADEKLMRSRLIDDREWFVQTPVEVQIDDGLVISTSLELPAIEAGGSLTANGPQTIRQ